MKSPNLLESKIKFFSLYWGQDVLVTTESEGSLKRDVVRDLDRVVRTSRLELKPLSSMSHQDATDLVLFKYSHENDGSEDVTSVDANLVQSNTNPHVITIISKITHKNQEDFIERLLIAPTTKLNFLIFQFIRSRGYILPWLDLSINDLLDYGWVEIKHNK